MGWKGTLRTIGAAARASEREAKRRRRELEIRDKQLAQMEARERAIHAVEVYENHIDLIQSIHKDCSNSINWSQKASEPPPQKPIQFNEGEKAAIDVASAYKPGFLDRLFKREAKVRKFLDEKVVKAAEADAEKYAKAVSTWEESLIAWKASTELSKRILSGDGTARINAIKGNNVFSEITALGSELKFSVEDNGIICAELNVHSAEIIPDEACSLLQSGKLSIKKIPTGKYNELFQDYVCSCVLRVGRELFALLPDNLVIVTATDTLLDTGSGHMTEMPILSAAISRPTLESLNLERIDPSDSMKNFVHNMTFKKAVGFSAVKRIDASEFSHQ